MPAGPLDRRCLLLALVAAGACRRPSAPAPPDAAVAQVGLASYYAPSLAGRRTASGEPYRPLSLTAAHRTLPLGTIVSVTRLDAGGRPAGNPVHVRINDRGPYAGNRILDLSHAAAVRLDMLRAGVVPVRIEVTAPGPPPRR